MVCLTDRRTQSRMWRRMYGLTMHQGYRYMHLPYYKRDAMYIKAMVSLGFWNEFRTSLVFISTVVTHRLPSCCECYRLLDAGPP